jgi:DNA (cytosine-5)-methyltransferase 1
MNSSPEQILANAYATAQTHAATEFLSSLSQAYTQWLQTVIQHAESHKGVLGVTLTSIVCKILNPQQDIRYHQEQLPNGYSGRGFDTRYVTPFLKQHFPHYAMAESAWLTRSLEQPHPYTFDYPGRIQTAELKAAFLNLLDGLQTQSDLASPWLNALLALMVESSATDETLLSDKSQSSESSIANVIEALTQHIHYSYNSRGGARIPVLAMYAIYQLLMSDVKRYAGKSLAPLAYHTSPDFRSQALGDIEVLNRDGSCFEAVEVKHNKPITADMLNDAHRKIKRHKIRRYYILTTAEPNIKDPAAVDATIARIRKSHPCQFMLNGVIPSLKYYLRLVSVPESFVDSYTQLLAEDFRRGGGINREHLQVWSDIQQRIFS